MQLDFKEIYTNDGYIIPLFESIIIPIKIRLITYRRARERKMEVKRLHHECLSCMAKIHLDKYPKDAADDQKTEYMQRVLKVLAEAPGRYGAPVIVRTINEIQDEMFAMKQDYAEIKKHYNQVMMNHEEQVNRKLAQSSDSVRTGIQYAMIGNYIDFGARINVNEEQLTELLNNSDRFDIDEKQYAEFVDDLSNARKLVYLTDNCGEIVMDKLKDLDAVAYVRFASVYREFQDIDSFMAEIKSLSKKQRRIGTKKEG